MCIRDSLAPCAVEVRHNITAICEHAIVCASVCVCVSADIPMPVLQDKYSLNERKGWRLQDTVRYHKRPSATTSYFFNEHPHKTLASLKIELESAQITTPKDQLNGLRKTCFATHRLCGSLCHWMSAMGPSRNLRIRLLSLSLVTIFLLQIVQIWYTSGALDIFPAQIV